MTATDPTPAVERAGDAYPEAYQKAVREAPTNRASAGISREDARKCYQAGMAAALTAALTDPHDPDWLARTLYVLASGSTRGPEWWAELPERNRVHWRAVADGLRATITGSAS